MAATTGLLIVKLSPLEQTLNWSICGMQRTAPFLPLSSGITQPLNYPAILLLM
jgi:hypothetical protein